MDVKILNKSKNVTPNYATGGSVGADLRSNENVVLKPKEQKLVKTGIYLELPKEIEAQIRSRSGLALKHGVEVLNSPGTIDPDYRGEVGVILINHSPTPYYVSLGDKIAQMVFSEVKKPNIIPVRKLSETERGKGGFGSTGK